MAFESNNFYVAKKNVLPASEFNVSCNINVEEDITSIFSVSSNVFVNAKEVLAGSVEYSGVVETCVVYMNTNGEVGSVHTSCPFTSKFVDADIKLDAKAVIFVKILGYNLDEVTEKTINVTYNLKQTGYTLINQEIESVTTNDEEILLKEENIKVVHFLGDNCQNFESQGVLNTREPIKKLLLCETQANIKEVEPNINFVTVTGDVVSRVLYLTESDHFESAYVFDTFKHEIEFDGMTSENQVDANVFVKFDEVKAVVDNQENAAKIEITAPIEICLMGYEETEVKVVSDLYSITSNVLIATESFDMTTNLPLDIFEGKIDGTLEIDEDKPRVDKIMFTAGNFINITNTYIDDGILTVEGIAKTNVVYLNDETTTLQSVELEVPFVLNEKVDYLENERIQVFALLTDVDVAVKKGRELFYDAKVKILVKGDKDVFSAVISNVNIEEDLPEKDYAMEIVFAKEGQTSWDIAKDNRVSEEMLLKQNPEVVFPLTEDKELILFYQNTKKSKNI